MTKSMELRMTYGMVRTVLAACVGVSIMACTPDEPRETGVAAAQPSQANQGQVGTPAAGELAAATTDTSVAAPDGDASSAARYALIDSASAEMNPTAGQSVRGNVSFTPEGETGEMLVAVQLTGLTPGMHGFHIHANGSCAADDGSSAGGHLNPYNTQHGGPGATQHHVGDLGNVMANGEGVVNANLRVSGLAFSGPASILQKAVIVHAGEDDLATDPSGDSGDRVSCGVIRQQNEVLADN